MKKILSLTLLIVFCLTPALTACGNDKPEEKTSGGIHRNDSSETDGYIVKNGSTEYKIVAPETTDSVLEIAVGELQTFFKEATGLELGRIEDEELAMSGSSRYFSVGKTSLWERSGLEAEDALLGPDGARVRTKNKIVYMYGSTSYGSLYAVYEFLGDALGYEFFYTDCYSLDSGVRNLKLKNFDITEVPDIEQRAANYGYISEDAMNLYRMRMRPYNEYFVPIKGKPFHNSIHYVEDEGGSHPLWYSNDKSQLCYTAHGDASEYELMVKATVKTMKQALIASPNQKIVTISLQDTNTICTCPACKADAEKYGAASASMVLFCNAVNKQIRAWFASEEGKPHVRDLEILFHAYQKSAGAPARFNEKSGKYESVGGIKCDEGVSVFYAPIEADYTHSFYEKENSDTRKTMEAWSAVSDDMYLWTYSTDFWYYMVPYDTFNSMQDIYRFAVERGTKWIFDQAQHTQFGSAAGWSTLKGYLNSKLAWNANLDFTALIEDFFETYYGPAAETMLELFRDYRAHSEYQKTELGVGGVMSCYFELAKEIYWQKSFLTDWYDRCNLALGEIEGLSLTSPERYAAYRDHITTERLTSIYLLVELYGYNSTLEFTKQIKMQFKEDATRVGLTNKDEPSRLAEMYRSWGV